MIRPNAYRSFVRTDAYHPMMKKGQSEQECTKENPDPLYIHIPVRTRFGRLDTKAASATEEDPALGSDAAIDPDSCAVPIAPCP